MKKRYYSFDIFDTCLSRLCGDSTNLFDILSLKVIGIMGCQNDEHLRQTFVSLRIKAGKKESTLEAIYAYMAHRFPLPKPVDTMIQMEWELEREMIAPISSTLKLINSIRGQAQIAFISDMYLPSTFLQERLSALGFFKKGDMVIVSNEWNARKYDGSLYQKIHEREGISYKKWVHYGDNRHSDYTVPKKLGIHAHLIEHKHLPYEKQWLQIPSYQFPWPSILAGISRSLRLQETAPREQSDFVCNISAPLMTAFVIEVMKDACRRNIKRLFFCARDMHSYFLIAKQFSHRFPALEIHYAFISGQVLYEHTENALAYFQQIGLACNDAPTAIVDTNTKGGTLPAINQMLKSHGWNTVHGYYITGISEASATDEENKLFHYSIFYPYVKDTGRQNAAAITGMRILYELVFCLNYHKKTVSYEFHGNIVRPVLAEDNEDTLSFKDCDIKRMKQSNDKLLVAYATAIEKTLLTEYGEKMLNSLALPNLVDFISYPNKTYLPYLNNFHLSGKPFVDKLYRKRHPIWKRGSFVYSLPTFMVKPCTDIARSEKKHPRVLKLFRP